MKMEIQYRTQLVELLKEFNLPLIGVEIGVAEGYNAADQLRAGMEKLYLVDAWEKLDQKGDGGFEQTWHDENYRLAMDRIKEFGERAVILKGLSYEMSKQVPDNSLGLVYLDGDHSYTGVMNDLKAWFPKLVEGGIIACHDYLNHAYGVYDAVRDFTEGLFEIHSIPENKHDDAGCWIRKIKTESDE